MENVKAPRQSTKSKTKPVFKVGDHVAVRYGAHKVPAVVVHDYGALGVGGRRILRVRLLAIDLESEFDVYPDRLIAARATTRRAPKAKARNRARARTVRHR